MSILDSELVKTLVYEFENLSAEMSSSQTLQYLRPPGTRYPIRETKSSEQVAKELYEQFQVHILNKPWGVEVKGTRYFTDNDPVAYLELNNIKDDRFPDISLRIRYGFLMNMDDKGVEAYKKSLRDVARVSEIKKVFDFNYEMFQVGFLMKHKKGAVQTSKAQYYQEQMGSGYLYNVWQSFMVADVLYRGTMSFSIVVVNDGTVGLLPLSNTDPLLNKIRYKSAYFEQLVDKIEDSPLPSDMADRSKVMTHRTCVIFNMLNLIMLRNRGVYFSYLTNRQDLKGCYCYTEAGEASEVYVFVGGPGNLSDSLSGPPSGGNFVYPMNSILEIALKRVLSRKDQLFPNNRMMTVEGCVEVEEKVLRLTGRPGVDYIFIDKRFLDNFIGLVKEKRGDFEYIYSVATSVRREITRSSGTLKRPKSIEEEKRSTPKSSKTVKRRK